MIRDSNAGEFFQLVTNMKNVLLFWSLFALLSGTHGFSSSLFPHKIGSEPNATSVEITARVWDRNETFTEPPTTQAEDTPNPSVNANVVRQTLQRNSDNDLFAEVTVDNPQPLIVAPSNPFPMVMDGNMPPPGMAFPMGPPVYPQFQWGAPGGFGYQPLPWELMRTPFYPYVPPSPWANPPPPSFQPYSPVYDYNREVYSPPPWGRFRRTPSYPPFYYPMHYDEYPGVEALPVSEEPVEPKPKKNRINFLVPTTPSSRVEQDPPKVLKAPNHHFPQHVEYRGRPIRHSFHNPFFRQHHYYY